MIGIFDSGDGGVYTAELIRELSPGADLCVLPDKANAPFGTKTREKLIRLTEDGIRRLLDKGAEKVLIACCTASTVYPYLSAPTRAVAVPIIDPTVMACSGICHTERLGVIATDATVSSGAFKESARRLIGKETAEYACQGIVRLVEGGARDGDISYTEYLDLKTILGKIKKEEFDLLILGCTHFPRLEKTISEMLEKNTVSSALAGAREVLGRLSSEGKGRTVYL